MAFEITELDRSPEQCVKLHAYSNGDETMAEGERVQIRADFGSGIIVLFDETVPQGKQWNNIMFQFQADEVDA